MQGALTVVTDFDSPDFKTPPLTPTTPTSGNEMDTTVNLTLPDTEYISYNYHPSKTTMTESISGCYIGRRDYMEDYASLHTLKNSTVVSVYDGHSGYDVAKRLHDYFAKELLVRTSKSSVKTAPRAIKRFYHAFDSGLRKAGVEGGSTAAVCLIKMFGRRRMLFTSNVGDSLVVLVDDKGRCERLAKEHKASVQSEVEGVVERGGSVFSGRVNSILAITRAFGDFDCKPAVTVSPSQHVCDITKGYRYIFTFSDGISDVMTDQELTDFVVNSMAQEEGTQFNDLAQTTISKVFKKCLDLGSKDNMSFVITQIH